MGASSLEAGTEGTVRSCQDVAKDQDSQCEPEQNLSSQAISGEEVIPTEIIINSCLIEQNQVDLSIEKEKHFQKPNFITSSVEESKLIDLKTLSDGLERGLENISETEKEEVEDEKEELHEVMDGECDSINHDPAA